MVGRQLPSSPASAACGAVEVDLQHASGRLFMELGGLPGSSLWDGDRVNLQECSQRQRRRGSGWLSQFGMFSLSLPLASEISDARHRRKLLLCPLIRTEYEI
uniref:Uncharacterized protein n=1 Tax=Micrurus paraensis TaxID=1970185 RepID=A0A2D4JVC1_9SAUR